VGSEVELVGSIKITNLLPIWRVRQYFFNVKRSRFYGLPD